MPNDEYFEAQRREEKRRESTAVATKGSKPKYWFPASKLSVPFSDYDERYELQKQRIKAAEAAGDEKARAGLNFGLWMLGRRLKPGHLAYSLRIQGIHDAVYTESRESKSALRRCSCGLIVPAPDIEDDGTTWFVEEGQWPDGDEGEAARERFMKWPGHRDLSGVSE